MISPGVAAKAASRSVRESIRAIPAEAEPVRDFTNSGNCATPASRSAWQASRSIQDRGVGNPSAVNHWYISHLSKARSTTSAGEIITFVPIASNSSTCFARRLNSGSSSDSATEISSSRQMRRMVGRYSGSLISGTT